MLKEICFNLLSSREFADFLKSATLREVNVHSSLFVKYSLRLWLRQTDHLSPFHKWNSLLMEAEMDS